MMFQNYDVTPLGNAQLSINQQGNLLVSNIGVSGLDGVMIQNNSNDSIHAFLEPIDLENGGTLRVVSVGKNSLNQVATRSETVTWLDTTTNRVQFGYNMGLIPKHYSIIGNLNGNPVFDIPMDNPYNEDPPPQDPQPCFWAALAAIAAAVTAAVAVYKLIAGTEEKTIKETVHPDGSKTVETTEKTDPTPIEVFVNGQSYVVDEWGIKYSETIPAIHTDKIMTIAALQITGYNLGNLVITSITT